MNSFSACVCERERERKREKFRGSQKEEAKELKKEMGEFLR